MDAEDLPRRRRDVEGGKEPSRKERVRQLQREHAEQQAGEPILLLVLLGVFLLIFVGSFIFAMRAAKGQPSGPELADEALKYFPSAGQDPAKRGMEMSFGPNGSGGSSFAPNGPAKTTGLSFSPATSGSQMSFAPTGTSGQASAMSFAPNSGAPGLGSGGVRMSFSPDGPSSAPPPVTSSSAGAKMSFSPDGPAPGAKMSFSPDGPAAGGPSAPSNGAGAKTSFGPDAGGKMSFGPDGGSAAGGPMTFSPSASSAGTGGGTSIDGRGPAFAGPLGIGVMGMGMGFDGLAGMGSLGSEMMFRAALQGGMIAGSTSQLHLLLPTSLLQESLIPKGQLTEIAQRCQVRIELGQEVPPDLRQVTLRGGLAANSVAAYFLQEHGAARLTGPLRRLASGSSPPPLPPEASSGNVVPTLCPRRRERCSCISQAAEDPRAVAKPPPPATPPATPAGALPTPPTPAPRFHQRGDPEPWPWEADRPAWPLVIAVGLRRGFRLRVRSLGDPGHLSSWERWTWEDWGVRYTQRRRHDPVPSGFAAAPAAKRRSDLTQRAWHALAKVSRAQGSRAAAALAKLAGPSWSNQVESILKQKSADISLVLDGPCNLSNAWTILRTMDAAGLLRLELIDKERDASVNDSFARALEAQPWILVRRWRTAASCIEALRAEGFAVWSLALTENSQPLEELLETRSLMPRERQKLAFVLGSEFAGVSREVQRYVDGSCIIPTDGMCVSFNVAVACSVLLATLDAKGFLQPGLLDEAQVQQLRVRWLLQVCSESEAIHVLNTTFGIEDSVVRERVAGDRTSPEITASTAARPVVSVAQLFVGRIKARTELWACVRRCVTDVSTPQAHQPILQATKLLQEHKQNRNQDCQVPRKASEPSLRTCGFCFEGRDLNVLEVARSVDEATRAKEQLARDSIVRARDEAQMREKELQLLEEERRLAGLEQELKTGCSLAEQKRVQAPVLALGAESNSVDLTAEERLADAKSSMKKLEEADLAKAESTPFVAPDREQEMLEIILTTGKAKDARLTDLLMKVPEVEKVEEMSCPKSKSRAAPSRASCIMLTPQKNLTIQHLAWPVSVPSSMPRSSSDCSVAAAAGTLRVPGCNGPLPRRIERVSMPVRVCPRSELLALREEVQRMRKEAMDVAGLKAEVEVLKTELRHILDDNRRMSDEIDARRRSRVEAQDRQQQAKEDRRRSQLDSARDLFHAMLAPDQRGRENVPPKPNEGLSRQAGRPAAQASSATGHAILIQRVTWHMPAPVDAQTFRSERVQSQCLSRTMYSASDCAKEVQLAASSSKNSYYANRTRIEVKQRVVAVSTSVQRELAEAVASQGSFGNAAKRCVDISDLPARLFRGSFGVAMSLFSGDNEIGNILQQAVKLKSAQMNEKRKTYETRPFFVQHTLFHGEKEYFKAWRQLPFDEKKVISERLKEEGNDLFKKGSWMDAIEKYEEAASLVHYYWSTDANWRKNNRGIDDDVLKLVDDMGSTEEDAQWQRKHRALCALNLAACKQKLDKFDEAITACDVTLELDPKNVKALYRRAESRIRPTKATAYDHDLAIKDLAVANALDPSNQTIERLLIRLRAERRVQREKDSQTYTGLFDRAQIYDKDIYPKVYDKMLEAVRHDLLERVSLRWQTSFLPLSLFPLGPASFGCRSNIGWGIRPAGSWLDFTGVVPE
ncbi:Peptidyl-prolyl cis-trans isomerase D [Symbiodinium microadriaticum]|uniref:peptidylprolyl isomerase n=1 Tax=Symbiodinium microadriaticum TaxID=2951 RepID=A0A1Q9D785_SYMMI|nr:Peptidyl-prolyl cis-trans isomerase D [Symbiodinium microadriaticum]